MNQQQNTHNNARTAGGTSALSFAQGYGNDQQITKAATAENIRPATKSSSKKKKVFEYRNSGDLASKQQRNQMALQHQQERLFNQQAVCDDYIRVQQIEAPQGGLAGSFGMSEIRSPQSNSAMLATQKQQAVDIIARTSAYQLKRQQAHQRQNGRIMQKDVVGIVGRRVDAPHIIVPQGPVGKNDYEQREQGNIVQSLANSSAFMQVRGNQTISLSPKHSPWKKPSSKNSTSNYAKGKPKNLFGQVKLNFVQSGTGKSTTHQKSTDKTASKNFKSQPGKGAESKYRASKSMEQVKHVHRQPNFAGSSQNVPKSGGGYNKQQQMQNAAQESHKNINKKRQHGQQHQNAGGRNTVLHNHNERNELSNDLAKQRRSGVSTRQGQRSQLNNFLDASMVQHKAVDRAGNATQIQIQNQSTEGAQNQITLNILTATADQFANKGGNNATTYQAGVKCKSVVAKHQTKDHGRQLIQTKGLNFQRKAHGANHSKERTSKSQEHGAGAASRTNHHRMAAGSRAKTALANQAQTTNATRVNSKGAVVNPFKQISDSQGRAASGSGGAVSTGHSRAFGASKNKTIEIERRRSKSRHGASGVLSETPEKDKIKQRARSGGSSNKRNQQILGVSASFSPRSRATTQFQEARDLLFENQSSGMSVNSKKQNLNYLLNNLDGRHKKTTNQKLIAGSQEYIAAPNQSSSILHGQQVNSAGASAINLSSALDPQYNLSSILLQQPPTDPNHSVEQYFRVSKENLQRTSLAETQVGDGSHQLLGDIAEDSRSTATRKLTHLNASLGKILNQSSLTHVQQQQRGGSSQSPRGGRANSKEKGEMFKQGLKVSNLVSASNTSRIDKIIQENLKKQGKKTMQRKIREQEEEQVSRQKKAELELVNERVRNANKEKVQRRKMQQMVLMQTNNTTKVGGMKMQVEHHPSYRDDQIRDEMERMLDELPENAIVKSNKGGKQHQYHDQNQSSIQQSSSTSKPTASQFNDDRTIKSTSVIQQSSKQLQARTQKIDLKFNSQQRMEGLILRVQKQTQQTQSQNNTQGLVGVSKASHNKSKTKGDGGLPPKQLIVNRLVLTKKDSGEGQQRRQVSQERGQNSSQQQFYPQQQHENDNTMPLPVDSATKIGTRFKDHRKSYGMEFIDIRKEIQAELKQFGPRKTSPKGTTGKNKQRTTNLRYIAAKDQIDQERIENGILTGGKNLRGSKSQRQVINGSSQHETSTIHGDNSVDQSANADLQVFRMINDSSILQNKTVVMSKPKQQVHITSLRIRPSNGDKKVNQTINGHGLGIVLKKEKIRKFMLRKQKQKQEEEEKTKLKEIQKTLKVHQNLCNLDNFTKKKQLNILPKTQGGGPKTGKNSQNNAHGTLRQRNKLTMRKNMTLIHDHPESQLLQQSGHNLTITPSKTALEVSEPSFNISAKMNQRVSNKQFKKVSNKIVHYKDISNSQNQPHEDVSIMQNEGNSSSRNRHRRSSISRRTDQQHYANRSINQLAPQFENSSSAKTMRTQLRTHKQPSSQSPPPPQSNSHLSRADPPHLNIKGAFKKGGPQATKMGKPPHAVQGHKEKNLKVGKKQSNKQSGKSRGKSKNQRRSQGGASGPTIQLNNNRQLNIKVPEAGGLTSKRQHQQILGQGGHQHHHSLQRSSIQTLESQESHARHQSSFLRQRRLNHSLVSAQNLSREGAACVIQKEVRNYLKMIGFYHARQIHSPDKEPQISLFIERRSRKSISRDSRKSKKTNSKSRSGSRGYRKSPQISHPASEIASSIDRKMIETTIIAELSGLKQTDLFNDDEVSASNNQSDFQIEQVQMKTKTNSNSHQKLRKSGQSQRRGGRVNRQQSSSSERDTSAKRQLARKQSQSKKPTRQLDPVLMELNIGFDDHQEQNQKQNQQLHEIISVQTPQSRTSKKMLNLDQPQQSLSAHRISDSEFDFRQGQSSVESNSVERLGVNTFNGHNVNDGGSQSTNSLFDRNAFQQYSQKKLNVIMQNSEQSKLIKFREEVLKFKEQKERKHIKKLFKQNQFSPRTFQAKQKQIDKWVQVQKQEIEKTKTTFKEEWEKTVQMIDDTQKNVDQIKSKMNFGPSHHSNSQVVSVSGASAAKQSERLVGVANQINNFNSQSCNSLSSHRNYQRNNLQLNNAGGSNQLALSGLGEHQRSILIEDPPKSYRSGRQEIPQMQILPIQGGVLPENNPEDTGHGSMGLLSSRRSANGGENNLHMAQSLLQYMEQRLASHNEQKQTSLSELKSKNDHENDQNLQDELDLKVAMNQIDVKAPPLISVDEPIENENFAKSQQMVDLVGSIEQVHSRKPSLASNIESEVSHQPSAEFLERLERVNKQEPFIQSVQSDKLDFTGFDEPLLPNATLDLDPAAIQSTQNNQVDSEKQPSEIDSTSQKEHINRGNFKNQVMTIKDFGAIDSKRTSQQSETSNEKEFQKMIANQKIRATTQQQNNQEFNLNSTNGEKSPTAEHLEEPSIVGKREIQQAVDTEGSKAAASAIDDPTLPQNIRISDMLKHQSKDLDDIIKDQNSQRSDTAAAVEDIKLLSEPAIISSSQTLDGTSSAPQTLNAESSTLIAAKVKPLNETPKPKLADIEKLIKSGDQTEKDKIIESLTDEVMKMLVSESVTQIPSRKDKDDKDAAQGDAPNHDVYYIDQLQSEKEERKEWIDLRQRHLIENDLIRIDQYVNEIVDALLQFEIDLSSDDDEILTPRARERRDKEQLENYHIQFLKQLTQPIQKPSSDILQLLQTSEIGSYKHFETTQDLQKYPIIPVNLYLEIEKAREEALLARKGSNMSKQTQMVWESIHIQNKSFFDAINESLMKFRPYGLTGEPMPWSNKIRRLQTKVDIGSVDTERLFQMVKQEVFRWSQAFCGSLPSPVFCFPTGGREKEQFNDQLFQENREKRLTQVLSAETVEQEHHWLNYEYEEAQVKIDLSDMILEHLVDELATFLNERNGVKSSTGANTVQENSNVEIYELMNDEPEFAKSQELTAGGASSKKLSPTRGFSPERKDQVIRADQNLGSLQK